jgi:hypothetical protein
LSIHSWGEAMRNEPLSVNALSLLLNVDRRTIGKWLIRAGTKPAAEGAHGPLYAVGDVVRVLASAPAALLADDELAGRFGMLHYQQSGAREFAGLLLRVLSKRLPPDALRAVRESMADKLLPFVEECEAGMRGRRYKRSEAPSWASMSERDLRGVLHCLIRLGRMPESSEESSDFAEEEPAA